MGNNRDASKAAAIKVTDNNTGEVTHVIIPAILQVGMPTGGETLTSASGSYETSEFVVKSESGLKYTRVELNNPNEDKGTTIRFMQGATKVGTISAHNSTKKLRFYAGSAETLGFAIHHNGLIAVGPSSYDEEADGGPIGARLNIKCGDTTRGGSTGTGGTGEGGIRLFENDNNNNWWDIYYGTSNDRLHFRVFLTDGHSSNGNGGYIDDGSDVGAIDFTGQHRLILKDPDYTLEDIDVLKGLIVVSSGIYDNLGFDDDKDYMPQINEALPQVTLSSSRNQKSVIGVISNAEDASLKREYNIGNWGSVYSKKSEDDQRLYINSLGEGGIWVANINGSLENGDYITTCEIPGYGMKQDDDLLHNYTVAKITQDCEFDLNATNYICEEYSYDDSNYKRAFVGCTYHCG